MSDELQDAEQRANPFADQVELLRGQNNELADTVKYLRAARTTLQQQRDELLRVAHNIKHSGVVMCAMMSGMAKDLDAAIKNCEPRGRETVADIRAGGEYAVSRLDKRLERARDESDYDTAVAVRDAARSLNSACGITDMEADALVAELDALAAAGGPLDDVDDPAYEPDPDSGSDISLLSVGPDILNRERQT